MNNNPPNKQLAVIGYSGHGFVAIDILELMGFTVVGYCDREKKEYNPYSLEYLGQETATAFLDWAQKNNYFISIGDNRIREKVYGQLTQTKHPVVNAIHPSAVISRTAMLADGIMIAAGAIINPLSWIGRGAICNTSSSIDHECIVGEFAHIGPGAVLCGNVTIGARTFVGAGSVVRQGIKIGDDVIIGAGAVVVKDVADHGVIIGNPGQNIKK